MSSQYAIIPGSLAAIAKRDGKSLAETFIGCDAVCIVDTSGSMDAWDSKGGRRRYAVACDELAQLQNQMPGKIGVIAFSSWAQFCPNGKPPFLGGGTDLASALTMAKTADVEGVRFIVISDGYPADPDDALRIAKTFRGRIDVVYVGPEDEPSGRDFLRRLAAASGGNVVTAARVKELAASVVKLLEA